MFHGQKPNRRDIVLGTVALSGALLMPGHSSAFSSIAVGSRKVSTLSDGKMSMPVSFLFPDVPQDELLPLLKANGFSTEALEPDCNLTLVEDGDQRILFDAGAGSNFMPNTGRVIATLESAGISPDSITDVIFTHGHPDHLWGILDDFDEIAFPEAKLHFPRIEWDFWRDEDTVNKMSEGRQTFAIRAQNRLAVMEDRVQLFDAGAEVVAGIEAMDTSGHTPGHMAFAIHPQSGSGDETVMVVGDALTNHIISFEKPDWPSGSDQDAEKGIQSRKLLLDRLASDKITLIGYHLPNGGLGKVERKDAAFRFVQET